MPLPSLPPAPALSSSPVDGPPPLVTVTVTNRACLAGMLAGGGQHCAQCQWTSRDVDEVRPCLLAVVQPSPLDGEPPGAWTAMRDRLLASRAAERDAGDQLVSDRTHALITAYSFRRIDDVLEDALRERDYERLYAAMHCLVTENHGRDGTVVVDARDVVLLGERVLGALLDLWRLRALEGEGFRALEGEILQWRGLNWGTPSMEVAALKVAEEAGELARTLTRAAERRPVAEDTAAEIGDVFIALVTAASLTGQSLSETVARRWATVSARTSRTPASTSDFAHVFQPLDPTGRELEPTSQACFYCGISNDGDMLAVEGECPMLLRRALDGRVNRLPPRPGRPPPPSRGTAP